MAFREVQRTKFINFALTAPGTKVVSEGIYLGAAQGKFGIEHQFRERTTEQLVSLSGGQLNKLIDDNVEPGMCCNVYYQGKETITKGPMAGKEAKQFRLEVEEGFVRGGQKALVQPQPEDSTDISL